MKVSIITAVLNGAQTLQDCINSVANQGYRNIEHIIIDGGSTDGTVDIIKKHVSQISGWVSEPDRGLYDAMNKGIGFATGDVIGILNADDLYADEHVINGVVTCFEKTGADSCYGDLVYIKGNDTETPVRYWKAGAFNPNKFRTGWMPPHPTFFVRREIYQRYGLFNLTFPLAADYELMLRFLYRFQISSAYIPKILVKMRTGGRCRPGWTNTINNMAENHRAWKVNHLRSNPLTFLLKPLCKTLQYVKS